ncbi:MAG: molybdenum cofactor biosynthesis protein MoaE [Thermodesulfobacterium sp.]|nr:molybdenum cofactor biosynthesis protein MoaE [Thermodesulfobacterium sp.]
MIFKNYEEYLQELKKITQEYKGKMGCIVEFNGFVREYDLKEGKKVPAVGLKIEETILEKLQDIREKAIKNYELIEVVIYHNVGFLGIGERVASIAILAKHRWEAFEAIKFIIEEMKKYH